MKPSGFRRSGSRLGGSNLIHGGVGSKSRAWIKFNYSFAVRAVDPSLADVDSRSHSADVKPEANE